VTKEGRVGHVESTLFHRAGRRFVRRDQADGQAPRRRGVWIMFHRERRTTSSSRSSASARFSPSSRTTAPRSAWCGCIRARSPRSSARCFKDISAGKPKARDLAGLRQRGPRKAGRYIRELTHVEAQREWSRCRSPPPHEAALLSRPSDPPGRRRPVRRGPGSKRCPACPCRPATSPLRRSAAAMMKDPEPPHRLSRSRRAADRRRLRRVRAIHRQQRG